MKNISRIYFLAIVLLLFMGTLMFWSMKDDSYTTDEILYLPTGYLYLTEQTMRLGFEHPPLGRDIAALPLLFLNLGPASDFLSPVSGYQLNNAVWNFGENFLFGQTNPPHEILLWARLPMILLTLFLGFLIFIWTKKFWGERAGLFAVFLFTFSPTILAHGRLITADVPVTLGAFVAVYAFARFLERPDVARTFLAGCALGVALLFKFSMLLLFPFFFLMFLFWFFVFAKRSDNPTDSFIHIGKLFLAVIGISLFVVAVVYKLHMLNYPRIQQAQDIQAVFNYCCPSLSPYGVWLSKFAWWEGLRPLAHYVFGALWQLSRTGAFGYFMGEGSGSSWYGYYPTGYLIKETIPLHLFTLFSVILVVYWIRKKSFKFKREHLFVYAAIAWVMFYWMSIIFINRGNTGIRYLLPTLPFVFFLVAGAVANYLRKRKIVSFASLCIGILMIWQVFSVLRIAPSFLAYFNESIGGPDNGYRYMVDTDLEWGQDVKRLAKWVKQRDIEKIKIPHRFVVKWTDYPDSIKEGSTYNRSFEYYLGKRYEYLPPNTPVKGWIAIPARLFAWGQARAASKNGWSSDSYRWLNDYEPIEKIGYSIFVYYID